MTALPASQDESTRGRKGGFPSIVACLGDAGLDFTVMALAAWTVIYHFCLVLRLGADVAALAALPAMLAAAWVTWLCAREQYSAAPASARWRRATGAVGQRHPRTGQAAWSGRLPACGPPGPAVPGRTERASRGRVVSRWRRPARITLAVVAAGSAAAAATLFALDVRPWWPTWLLWSSAALAGVARALVQLPDACVSRYGSESRAVSGDAPSSGRRGWLASVTALGCAIGLAVLTLFLRRPNKDDAHYLHQSAWVAERGTFPLRDTLFSDQVFPALYWPPVASYDPLIGVLSRVLGVHHLNVAYLAVPAIGTFLATLALWRLLRVWSVRAAPVALLIAVLFLLWGGGEPQTYGNFFLGRMWQGKVLLLCLIVPLLLVHQHQFAQNPTGRRLLPLGAVGIAAVGLSANAIYLIPLLAVAGAATSLLSRTAVRALAAFAAAAFYPLAAGAVTLVLGGYTPDRYARQLDQTVPPWLTHHVLGTGVRAWLALFAILAGSLLVWSLAGRVTVAGLALVAAAVYSPGMPLLLWKLTGLGVTLWRVMWILPAGALLGVIAARAVSSARRSTRPLTRLTGLATPLALGAILVGAGVPIWAPGNLAALTVTPQWERPPESVRVAHMVLRHSQPGDTVLAPESVSITLATMTTRVKTIATREFYMNRLRDLPSFHYERRLLLKRFIEADLRPTRWEAIPDALATVGVQIACTDSEHSNVIDLVRRDYRLLDSASGVRCFARDGARAARMRGSA